MAKAPVTETPAVNKKTNLYRVTFRRRNLDTPTSKTRVYITVGVDEDAAIDHIWDAFTGSSFHNDFDRESAMAEFILGGLLKIGGN